MIILPKELLEKLETSEYLSLNDREQLIKYIEVMEDFKIFYELYNVLENRIDKAIEYIENAIETGNCSEDISYENDIEKEHNYYVNSKDILQILKGSAKE